MEERNFTIEELAAELGITPRTIRYYQTEGYLQRPALRDRKAVYSAEHLKRLQEILAQKQDKDMKLVEIGATLAAPAQDRQRGAAEPANAKVEEVVRFIVRDGIELLVAPERAKLSRALMQRLFSEIAVVVKGLKEPEKPSQLSFAPATPEGSGHLLDLLVSLGLNDEAFRVIHPKPGETIQKHRQYVESRSSFHPDSTNVFINHRLQLLLRFVEAARERGEAVVWYGLARRVAETIPLLNRG